MICEACPRNCGVDREKNVGFCRMGELPKAARASLHFYEEPCISGTRGSGTVFFSGCSLRCRFCQNYSISHGGYGQIISIERLSEIFLELQEQGAHNINLVNPTIFYRSIIRSIEKIKHKISIPFVWNSSGYEKAETIKELEGYIDVYLPDLKYFSPKLSYLYSGAEDYFKYASEAILEMYRQVGGVRLNDQGIIEKGLIIRHLILPNSAHDSVKILKWIHDNIPSDAYISLMSQYTPIDPVKDFPGLGRRITKKEYDFVVEKLHELGLKNGYVQGLDSACLKYTPAFDLSGINKVTGQ